MILLQLKVINHYQPRTVKSQSFTGRKDKAKRTSHVQPFRTFTAYGLLVNDLHHTAARPITCTLHLNELQFNSLLLILTIAPSKKTQFGAIWVARSG